MISVSNWGVVRQYVGTNHSFNAQKLKFEATINKNYELTLYNKLAWEKPVQTVELIDGCIVC